MIDKGYDGIIDNSVSQRFGSPEGTQHIIVFDSNQIKSANAVTYDNNGNVIPLSERFNESNKDIRFSRKKSTVFTGEEKQKKLVYGAKTAFPALSDFKDETVYRVVVDKNFYERIGWAYASGELPHADAVEFGKIIERKQIGNYTPRSKSGLYYVLAGGSIVVTDGDFDIPTIFKVVQGPDIDAMYHFLQEKIN